MSLPRYPAYKDSGVAWLDELPSHWGNASLKWVSKRYAGGTPDKARQDFWTEGTIPWLNSGSVNDQQISEPSAYITQEAYENSSAKWIPAGALVMALAGQGKTKGTTAQVLFETTCNQSMAAIIPTSRIEARYLFWWLTRNYQNIRNMAGGDLRDGLNLELLGGIPCPLPTFAEQSAIATFLDRETGKIDTLIAEQEKLLTLLAEKRQATISHAVTRGLNPDAPMKDSRVAWLGKVPAHWDIVPLKHLVSVPITDGPHESPVKRAEGVPFISAESIGGGYIDFEKAWGYISLEDHNRYSERFRPQRGDLLLVKLGATAGTAAIVETDSAFSVWVPLACIRPRPTLKSRFLLHTLRSENLKRAYQLYWTYGTQQTLGLKTISELRIPIPPLSEQVSVVNYLDAETSKFEALAAPSNQAIALLRERRSALIAAAVTGKIDVREQAAVLEVAA